MLQKIKILRGHFVRIPECKAAVYADLNDWLAVLWDNVSKPEMSQITPVLSKYLSDCTYATSTMSFIGKNALQILLKDPLPLTEHLDSILAKDLICVSIPLC